MNKAQWKAVYDFCADNKFTLQGLLIELKKLGVVSWSASIRDLHFYVSGVTYNDMKKFLETGIEI